MSRSIRRSVAPSFPDDPLDTFFNDFFGRPRAVGFAPTPKWRPPTDVYEDEDAFHVTMDLAGVEPANIAIEWEGEVLSVSGIRADGARGKRNYYSMEIQVGPFERRIRISRSVDAGSVVARYERGFLEIRLPKAAERPTGPRRIPIQ